uniref:Rho-GAP domain-containing protein n=1 Tax=Gongylonema pulchrum TaxID=637853 RepID=A0A183F012_9BILA
LLRIAPASAILEAAYNDYANALQRFNIIIEFYGADFPLFKTADNKIRSLEELIAEEPSRKASIIKYLEQTLTDIVDK